jgi:spore maturation protein CgeB
VSSYVNIKVGVFEAAACRVCVLVQDFDEVKEFFSLGEEVVTYTSKLDAVSKALSLCKKPNLPLKIGQATCERVLSEHTWEHRWNQVLGDVYEIQ